MVIPQAIRYHPRIPRYFDQVGHQTTFVYVGNKHFFTKSCPTKIMNNLLKDCKIRTFKVIFQHQKSAESFWSFSVKNIWLGDQLLLINFLVGLIMTWFSEKMCISCKCIHSLMPNLIKKILDGIYQATYIHILNMGRK